MADTGSIANGVADLALDESAIPDGLEDLMNKSGTGAPEPAAEDTEPAKSVAAETVTDDLFSQSGKSESDSESKEHKLGLDINYPYGWAGSKYNDYDLITVHGIRDDYKTAWIDKDGQWWANVVLFKDLSVREVDYSYEIDEDSILYEPNGIKHLAEKLVNEYAEEREKLEDTETDRPILWICHDLGGTIVKEALSLALSNPQKYGKIALLSTAIVFLGTPHRAQSIDDLEDQLHKLIVLPGPEIKNRVFNKVQHLAKQVTDINDQFLATKLLDRTVSFNVFSQNIRDSLKGTASQKIADIDSDSESGDDIDEFNTITPFPRYAHFAGQSFEAAGRIRVQPIDHVDLVRGDPDDVWMTDVRDLLNVDGCILKADYRILKLQREILSLAPPTRGLDTPFDPVVPKPAVVKWIYDQDVFKKFTKPGIGLRVMHIHGSGNNLIDLVKMSRLVYVDHNSFSTVGKYKRSPQKTTVYFEFNKWDSRYNNISSLLTYLINMLVWNFWNNCLGNIIEELTFMDATKSCTLDDLYHVYSLLRDCVPASQRLTIFISCFDQCPEEQRKWFLDRLLEEQTYTETEYRLIFSTLALDDLVSDYLPPEISIDLDDCPEVAQTVAELPEGLRLGLGVLVEKRHVYEDVRPQLEDLLKECGDAPHLGNIILTWLGRHLRGRPRSEIIDAINSFMPVTASNVLNVFISSLTPSCQARAATIFNWVKHASEPWSPESLAEAIAIDEGKGNEPCFEDLDIEDMLKEIEDSLCGIIVVRNRDVKFSHPSFYSLPEISVEGSAEEREARVHSSIASACLRYFQFKCGRDQLLKIVTRHLVEGAEDPVSPPLVFYPRTSLAEYAVRFWPQHYKASGNFKPTNLVNDLFANKETQAAWAAPFWLMSNSFTRIERTLYSRVSVFAMLGLKDLVDEAIISDKDTPSFEKDCWLAIAEAGRAGHDEIALQLLEIAEPNDEELSMALTWVAPSGSSVILDALVKKICNRETFKWKEKLLHRVAATGIDSLLSAMLQSGCDVNETYGGTLLSPTGMAASRNRLSTMKLLLSLEPKPDFYVKVNDGDFPLLVAISKGNPSMIELLLQEGVEIEKEKNSEREAGQGPAQLAVKWCRYKALDMLIKAGADFKTGKTEDDALFYDGPPLIVAADQGLQACVGLLLDHKADEDVNWSSGTALYNAVAENHIDIVRTLLKHEPKPDMNIIPEGQESLLIRAIVSESTELISLLLENGAIVDYVDSNCSTFCKTPLSRACYEGNLDIVKLLLEKGANVNYTGEGSDAPLFTALYENQVSVGKHLLEQEGVDVMWAGEDSMGILHAAFNHPNILIELLKRGVPIDGHGIYGTALQMAARDDFPKSIEVLLKHDPKPDLEYVFGEDGVVPEEIGYTALQLACCNTAPECLKLLLDAGANPEFRNKNGDDALDILIKLQKDPKGTIECVELLLSKRYNVSLSSVDGRGQGRLHKIGPQTPLSIVKMLVESNTPLDSPDQDGYTPLALAVSARNVSVSEYLLSQGANPRTIGAKFGSILHIAVSIGSLTLVKLLLKTGADCDTVHPEYGESLLHAALGISAGSALKKTVRYLVDEVKVPVDKLGGEFSYPIVRAAYMTKMNYPIGLNVLKFLIRRKAQLNVADKQGRRAVHIASVAYYDGAIKALVAAGADINVKDKFGRLPIHFAASSPFEDSLLHLLSKFEDIDIEAKDYDRWTPLLWAARSGDIGSVEKLVDRGADVWARGGSSYSRTEWSALKLINFANRVPHLKDVVTPKELSRTNTDGETEEWDEYFHKSKRGYSRNYFCDSCLATIIGIQWKCIECKEDWSLCFKCAGNRADIHNPEHSFEELEPWYDETPKSASPGHVSVNGEPDAPELPVEFAQDVVEGDVNGVVNGEMGHEAVDGDVEPEFDLDAMG